MSMRSKVREAPRDALFDALADTRTGMLAVEGSGQLLQPMTHHADRATGEIWFITSIETDLVRAVGLGGRAQYCLASKAQDLHASMSGTLEQVDDPEKLDSLWSPFASAWFAEGREDPKIILLRLTLLDAELWASSESAVVMGIEMVRAAISPSHSPDLADHSVIRFTDPV